MAHTPGPWRSYCNDVTEAYRAIGDSGVRYWSVEQANAPKYRGQVCDVHAALEIGGISLEERDANARLIAASPEMLDALMLAEPVIAFSLSYYGSEDADEALQAVRDAIAKATA